MSGLSNGNGMFPAVSWGVCAQRSLFPNCVCCDPRCRQSLRPHRLTSPLAVSAEDLLLICKLNDIKDFSASQWQVLPSTPLLRCCRVNHHLSQDVDASFKLEHKQQRCSTAATPGEQEPGSTNRSPFLEKADPSLSKWSVGLVRSGDVSVGDRAGVTWAGRCGAQLLPGR